MKTATKKRVTAILLVTTLLASLCGCAGKTEPSSEKPQANSLLCKPLRTPQLLPKPSKCVWQPLLTKQTS